MLYINKFGNLCNSSSMIIENPNHIVFLSLDSCLVLCENTIIYIEEDGQNIIKKEIVSNINFTLKTFYYTNYHIIYNANNWYIYNIVNKDTNIEIASSIGLIQSIRQYGKNIIINDNYCLHTVNNKLVYDKMPRKWQTEYICDDRGWYHAKNKMILLDGKYVQFEKIVYIHEIALYDGKIYIKNKYLCDVIGKIYFTKCNGYIFETYSPIYLYIRITESIYYMYIDNIEIFQLVDKLG